MLSKLNDSKIANLDQFKKFIQCVWEEMLMKAVHAACKGCEKCLKLVKTVKGEVIPKHL